MAKFLILFQMKTAMLTSYIVIMMLNVVVYFAAGIALLVLFSPIYSFVFLLTALIATAFVLIIWRHRTIVSANILII